VWQGYPKRRLPEPRAGHDLLDKMGFDPCDIDGLIARSGLTAEKRIGHSAAVGAGRKSSRPPGGLYHVSAEDS